MRLATQPAQLIDADGIVRAHDSYDFVKMLVQINGLPHDGRVSSEYPFPCGITEHDNLAVAGLVFLRREDTALGGLRSKDFKPSPGHTQRRETLRICASRVTEVCRFRDSGSQKDLRAIADIVEVAKGDDEIPDIQPVLPTPDHDPTPPLGNSARIEQQRVDRAENRRIRANGERQSQDRKTRKPWRSPK